MPQVVILPSVIEQRLNEDEREQVSNFINKLLSDTSNELKVDIIEIVEERFDKRLTLQISGLKVELNEKISGLKVELNEKIDNNKIELIEKIANSKAEIIKWMFIFWIGSVITIVGAMVGVLKIAGVF